MLYFEIRVIVHVNLRTVQREMEEGRKELENIERKIPFGSYLNSFRKEFDCVSQFCYETELKRWDVISVIRLTEVLSWFGKQIE